MGTPFLKASKNNYSGFNTSQQTLKPVHQHYSIKDHNPLLDVWMRRSHERRDFSETSEAAFSSRYRADLTDYGFLNPHIELLGSKAEVLGKIRNSFKIASKKTESNEKRTNAHYVNGPSGHRPSDVFLARAIENLQNEDHKNSNKDFSNVVIITDRDASCYHTACRLIDLCPINQRADLAERIEILQTYKPKSNPNKAPKARIFVISKESLNKVNANIAGAKKTQEKKNKPGEEIKLNADDLKSEFASLEEYIHLGQVKYLYLDNAQDMGSDMNREILDYFRHGINKNPDTGPAEFIATAHTHKIYKSTDEDAAYDIRSLFEDDKQHYLGSIDELTGTAMPLVADPIIKESDVYKPLVNPTANKKRVSFADKYAHNREEIRLNAVTAIKNFIADGDSRIVVRVSDIQSMNLLVDELRKDPDGPIAVGWTNHNESDYAIDKKTEHKTSRIKLLDKFGKDFKVLVNCKSLDGEEFPADSVVIYHIPANDHELEAITAPIRTASIEQEASGEFNLKPRALWMMDIGEKRKGQGDQTAKEQLEAIETRHQAEVNGSVHQCRSGACKSINSTIAKNATKKGPNRTTNGRAEEFFELYEGNLNWLDYFDRIVVPGTGDLNKRLKDLAHKVQQELNGEAEFSEFDENTILDMLKGKVSHLEGARFVLALALDFANANPPITLNHLIARFPNITGLVDDPKEPEREARIRVHFMINFDKANPAWLKVLRESFGSDEAIVTNIAKFIHSKYKKYLYDNHLLDQTLRVLLRSTSSLNEDEALGTKVFDEFFKLCVVQPRFNVLAARDIYPQGIDLTYDLRTRDRARIATAHLIEQGAVAVNPDWLNVLGRRLGIPATDNDAQQRRLNFINDFLCSNKYSACLRDPTLLTRNLNTLMGTNTNLNGQDRQLAADFFIHINGGTAQGNRRINAVEFNRFFPDTIDQSNDINGEARAQSSIEYLMREDPPIAENLKWMLQLNKAVKANGNPIAARNILSKAYADFLFSRTNRSVIFSSPENTINAIRVLQGQNNGIATRAEEQRLFTDFVRFVEANYQHEFQPLEIRATAPNLFLIEANNDAARRKLVTNAAQQYKITATGNWLKLLSTTNLIDYVVNQHTAINNPLHAAQALAFYAGHKLTNQNLKELRAVSAVGEDLILGPNDMHQFCTTLKANSPTITGFQIAETAPVAGFRPAATIQTIADAEQAIAYATRDKLITSDADWIKLLKKIDSQPLTPIRKYLFSKRNNEPSPFANKASLAQTTQILLGGGTISTLATNDTTLAVAQKEEARLIKDFNDYIKQEFSGKVRPMAMTCTLPGYFRHFNIIRDKASAFDVIKYLFQDSEGNIADRKFPNYLLTAMPDVDKRLKFLTDFLWDRDPNHAYFQDLDGLVQNIEAAMGGLLEKFKIPALAPSGISLPQELFAEFYRSTKALYPDVKNHDNYSYHTDTNVISLVEDIKGPDDLETITQATTALLKYNAKETIKADFTWLSLLTNILTEINLDEERQALTIKFLVTYIAKTYPNCLKTDDDFKEVVSILVNGKKDFQGNKEIATKMINDFYQAVKVEGRKLERYIPDSRAHKVCDGIQIDPTDMLEILQTVLRVKSRVKSGTTTSTETTDLDSEESEELTLESTELSSSVTKTNKASSARLGHMQLMNTLLLPLFGCDSLEELAQLFQVPITTASQSKKLPDLAKHWIGFTLGARDDTLTTNLPEIKRINIAEREMRKKDISTKMMMTFVKNENKATSLLMSLLNLADTSRIANIDQYNYVITDTITDANVYEYTFLLRPNTFVCRFKNNLETPAYVLEGTYKLENGRWQSKPEIKQLSANSMNLLYL